MMRKAAILLMSLISTVEAHAAPAGYFDLRPGVTLESGDTWTNGGKRYRLYGVQSCLRGTSYTNAAGEKRDCGEASLAVFAAFIKDTQPICAPAAQAPDLTYVVCYGVVQGQQLDLATMMIAKGYAFAALDARGLPYLPAYSVAEADARQKAAGLWQFKDVTHPSILLSQTANQRLQKENP